MSNPFRYFNSSPEVIRLVVMMYVRYPLSLRNVEDLLAERGIDISHETVRFWWNRFGPMFAAEIRKKRVAHMRGYPQWRWHLDEVFVKVNGKLCYLWRAVDHEGEGYEAGQNLIGGQFLIGSVGDVVTLRPIADRSEFDVDHGGDEVAAALSE